MPKTNEEMKQYQAEWYIKNKSRLLEKQKNWTKNNRDKILNYQETDNYQKSFHISIWKGKGVKGDLEEIWERYINTINCDLCGTKLTMTKKITSTRKSLEHNHSTGELRSICCHSCNMKPHLKNKYSNNTSGHKSISFDKSQKKWRYTRGKNRRRFKSKIDCLCYKFIRILID
tara:strand:+ start:123 stop:641 length:519 start_codon:yes stop_codon:yes gene_type:complete